MESLKLTLPSSQDCALLAPCPACAQVVEVAGLPEHLLDECDQKASFVPCDVTGKDAIDANTTFLSCYNIVFTVNEVVVISINLLSYLLPKIFFKYTRKNIYLGLAIRENEMAAWEQSSKCSPAPANCMYCPLCLASVEDTNDAWKEHLIYGCSENKRGSSHK